MVFLPANGGCQQRVEPGWPARELLTSQWKPEPDDRRNGENRGCPEFEIAQALPPTELSNGPPSPAVFGRRLRRVNGATADDTVLDLARVGGGLPGLWRSKKADTTTSPMSRTRKRPPHRAGVVPSGTSLTTPCSDLRRNCCARPIAHEEPRINGSCCRGSSAAGDLLAAKVRRANNRAAARDRERER